MFAVGQTRSSHSHSLLRYGRRPNGLVSEQAPSTISTNRAPVALCRLHAGARPPAAHGRNSNPGIFGRFHLLGRRLSRSPLIPQRRQGRSNQLVGQCFVETPRHPRTANSGSCLSRCRQHLSARSVARRRACVLHAPSLSPQATRSRRCSCCSPMFSRASSNPALPFGRIDQLL